MVGFKPGDIIISKYGASDEYSIIITVSDTDYTAAGHGFYSSVYIDKQFIDRHYILVTDIFREAFKTHVQ